MHSLILVASILYPPHKKHTKNSFKSCTFNFWDRDDFGASGLGGGGILLSALLAAVVTVARTLERLIGIAGASM